MYYYCSKCFDKTVLLSIKQVFFKTYTAIYNVTRSNRREVIYDYNFLVDRIMNGKKEITITVIRATTPTVDYNDSCAVNCERFVEKLESVVAIRHCRPDSKRV